MFSTNSERNTLALKAAVFAFFLSIYVATMPYGLINAVYNDSQFMFFVSQSLVEDGDVIIWNQTTKDSTVDDDEPNPRACMTSNYPLVPSLVGIPFYVVGTWVSRILNKPQNDADLYLATALSGAVLSALACLLLFQFAAAMGFRLRTAGLLTCCYGLGTIAWSYAHYISTEANATVGVLGAAYAAYLYKIRGRSLWLYLSGFLSGVAAGSRELSILIVPPMLVYLTVVGWERAKEAPLKSKLMQGARHLAVYLLGLVPFLIMNIWYNFARYGVMTNMDYLSPGSTLLDLFNNPLFLGLYGLLLSPGQGLFLYCPILLLMLWSVSPFYAKHKVELLLFASSFLLHLLVYAKLVYWHNGYAFGPRYLLPVVPLLILTIAPFLEKLPSRSFRIKAFTLFIICASIATQLAPFRSDLPLKEVYLPIPENLKRVGEGVVEFLPQSFHLLWPTKPAAQLMSQFYFLPKSSRSLRLPILLVLLGTTIGTGFYLARKLRLFSPIRALRSAAARIMDHTGSAIRTLLAFKTAAGISALLLIALGIVSYAAFKYAWVPLTQFNSKPFGAIEYPNGPPVTGEIQVEGWALDRSGIRAVEVYVDNVKAADARLGEPSPDVRAIYPYIPNSDRARYMAALDTSIFPDGIHALQIRVVNGKGKRTDIASEQVFFLKRDYDFWTHLQEAEVDPDKAATDTTLSINQETRRVILQQVGSQLTFRKIPVYSQGFLKLGIGLAQDQAGGPEASNELLITILANLDKPLFSRRIEPKAYAANPQWHDERIDLSQFQDQIISLTLIAKMESDNNGRVGYIGWSDLSVVYPDQKGTPE